MIGDVDLADGAFARFDAAGAFDEIADSQFRRQTLVQCAIERDEAEPFGLGPFAGWTVDQPVCGDGNADDGAIAFGTIDAAKAAGGGKAEHIGLPISREPCARDGAGGATGIEAGGKGCASAHSARPLPPDARARSRAIKGAWGIAATAGDVRNADELKAPHLSREYSFQKKSERKLNRILWACDADSSFTAGHLSPFVNPLNWVVYFHLKRCLIL